MSDNDNGKTQYDFDKIVDDAEDRGVIDKEGGYRLKHRFRINTKWGKFWEHIAKHWKKWVLAALASGGVFLDNLKSVIMGITQ